MRILFHVTCLCLLFGCASNEPASDQTSTAAQLYHNGHIITMAGDKPSTVEALVTQNGKIVYSGDLADAVENLGEARAFFLSPITSADSLGLNYTNHSDATVTPVNPLYTVWTAVNRVSRSGISYSLIQGNMSELIR